jgi:group I intron endonuclease
MNDVIRLWTIYKIVNPVNSVYVGVTQNFKQRMYSYEHKPKKSQALLYGSLKKHGFDKHKISVLETFDSTKSHALAKEMFWIRSFMSNRCKWRSEAGLNLTSGGEGVFGRKMTQEQIKRMSEYLKANPRKPHLGKPLSESHKAKIRQKMMGKHNNPSFGKAGPEEIARRTATRIELDKTRDKKKRPEVSEETRRKRSISMKGRLPWNTGIKLTDKQKSHLWRPVIKSSINGDFISEYKSIKEASDSNKDVSYKTIVRQCAANCIPKRKHNNFYFKYKQQ